MMMRKIREYLAPPVADAEAELEDARKRNAKAEKTMHDMRSHTAEALERVRDSADYSAVENGVGGE